MRPGGLLSSWGPFPLMLPHLWWEERYLGKWMFFFIVVYRVLKDLALCLYLSRVDDERFTQKKSLVL